MSMGMSGYVLIAICKLAHLEIGSRKSKEGLNMYLGEDKRDTL